MLQNRIAVPNNSLETYLNLSWIIIPKKKKLSSIIFHILKFISILKNITKGLRNKNSKRLQDDDFEYKCDHKFSFICL